MSVTQTAISARIKNEILWNIEQEKQLGLFTRNRILNEGAVLFLDVINTRREYRAHPQLDVRQKIIKGFVKRWFPDWNL